MSTDKSDLAAGLLLAKRDLNFAKLGLAWALLSGMIFALNAILLDAGLKRGPFADSPLWLLAPLTAAAMHDTVSCCWILALTTATGRLREIGRSMFTRSGAKVCLGALFGGPLGTGGYIVSLKLIGPAYVLPITSLYPVVASVLAMIFLKERISPRAWVGLACCVIGGFIIGYSPPESGQSSQFYLGLGMAVVATLGWGSEGVLSTSGMDLLDPTVAMNIRQIVSGLAYMLIVLPLLGGWSLLGQAVTSAAAPIIVVAAGLGASSYLLWYKAMNMTGVSRAMALSITYALWGILFSALFTDTVITVNLLVGAVVISMGMFLVVGNVKDITNLRKINLPQDKTACLG